MLVAGLVVAAADEALEAGITVAVAAPRVATEPSARLVADTVKVTATCVLPSSVGVRSTLSVALV